MTGNSKQGSCILSPSFRGSVHSALKALEVVSWSTQCPFMGRSWCLCMWGFPLYPKGASASAYVASSFLHMPDVLSPGFLKSSPLLLSRVPSRDTFFRLALHCLLFSVAGRKWFTASCVSQAWVVSPDTVSISCLGFALVSLCLLFPKPIHKGLDRK